MLELDWMVIVPLVTFVLSLVTLSIALWGTFR